MDILHQRNIDEKRYAEAHALQEMKSDAKPEPLIRHAEHILEELDRQLEAEGYGDPNRMHRNAGDQQDRR